MDTLTGSCHCGQVQFTIEGPARLAVNCHCNDCRRRNGSAFSSYLVIDEAQLRLTGTAPAQYRLDNTGSRAFCPDCGTPLYNQNQRYPGKLIVFLGILDGPVPKPGINLYTDDQLDWTRALDTLRDLPQGMTG